MAKKWDPFKREYSDFEVPEGWDLCFFTNDPEAFATCPQCGQEHKVYEGYTSQEFYSDNGIWGCSVCEACHFQELKRRAEAEGWQ